MVVQAFHLLQVLVEPHPLPDSVGVDSVHKTSKIKFFGKKKTKTKEEQARAKAEEKDGMKAKKLEREKTMELVNFCQNKCPR